MKNVYVLDEYLTSRQNGIGVFVSEFIGCLLRMKVNVCHIVFNSFHREFTLSETGGIKTIYFPRFPSGSFLGNPETVVRFFRMHIQDSAENVFCLNHSPCVELLETIRQWFPLSKLVFTIHNFVWTLPLLGDSEKLAAIVVSRDDCLMDEKLNGLLVSFDAEAKMYRILDAVVCLAEGTARVLEEIYKIDRKQIHLISNGLKNRNKYLTIEEKKRFREENHIRVDERIIIFAGRLSESKGTDALIEAFRNVLNKFPDIRLVLAGGNQTRFSQEKYADVASKITYTGHIDHQELQRWYGIADIGVIPSYTEQCSYVGIEMMMHGLPIVASDGFGVRDMFQDGVNAVIAPIGCRDCPKEFINNLSEAFLKLLTSPKWLEKIGVNAKNTYFLRYDVTKMQEKYQQLFDSL